MWWEGQTAWNGILDFQIYLDKKNMHSNIALKIRDCEISARRTDEDGHGLVDLTAFNTDGFDVSGQVAHENISF